MAGASHREPAAEFLYVESSVVFSRRPVSAAGMPLVSFPSLAQAPICTSNMLRDAGAPNRLQNSELIHSVNSESQIHLLSHAFELSCGGFMLLVLSTSADLQSTLQ